MIHRMTFEAGTRMDSGTKRVFAELKKYRLLLRTDARLPNICALVAGETVRGSWWAHPRSHAIFQVDGELADHPDVLMVKLISNKVTYVHRILWHEVIAIGCAREPWQTEHLSGGARKLLAAVDRMPVQPDRSMNKAASELETKLLLYSEQFHTESGTHVRRLESWEHWSGRAGFAAEPVTVANSKLSLENVLASLNQKFNGTGRLPWQVRSSGK